MTTAVRFGAAVAAGAGALGCGIGLLATSAWLISRAAQHPPVLYLMVAIVAVRAFGFGRGALRYVERLVSHDAALRVQARTRVRVFTRLAAITPALPHAAPVRAGASDAAPGTGPASDGPLGLVLDNAEGVADRWLRGVLPMASAGLAGAAAVALEGWLLPAAGAVLLAALLTGGVLAPWLAQRGARRAAGRAAAGRAELSARTTEALHGLPELTAYGALPARLADLRRADARVTASAARSAWTAGLGSGLTTLATGGAVLGALALGVPAVRDGRLETVLLAVIVLTPLAAFEAVGALSDAAQRLLRARTDAARVRHALATPAPVTDPDAPRPLPAPARGHHLRVDGVTARWPGAGTDALAEPALTLDLPPGRRLMITGPNGSGKSTLAAVLARLLDYRGSITLDGTELRDLAGGDVRRVIGLCGQDAHLFDTTVAENVRLARPAASDADVAAALRRAGLGGWLDALPDGLATRVGEHGTAVSGGERQRLALARALLAGVPILILDEPDAHLDEATAGTVLIGLLAAARDRTVVLISHRDAVPGADPVLRHVDELHTLGPLAR
ncbi:MULTISPECIES: thiol reductant ABC exporter subunit CydC [Thermomonosporaceae]|uniref:thiol reductant ABC exporter subunit CydC n=1 Tax=Thermomonosporaceae TaxID=2012 RepID=UPI00255B251C|nr:MULTISPECIES: thiol reductant ABC exporter subunit CydC [Thermomonosporaceae]MDL4771992.1 thiol reductant ABC exporter subunit CydC [Actinomadura xylanilytica]